MLLIVLVLYLCVFQCQTEDIGFSEDVDFEEEYMTSDMDSNTVGFFLSCISYIKISSYIVISRISSVLCLSSGSSENPAAGENAIN